MRKDGAKEFLQCPENRVQIVFFVSKTCTRKRNLRQSQLRKANFEQKSKAAQMCFCMRRLVACWRKVSLCQVKLQTTVNKCVFAWSANQWGKVNVLHKMLFVQVKHNKAVSNKRYFKVKEKSAFCKTCGNFQKRATHILQGFSNNNSVRR